MAAEMLAAAAASDRKQLDEKLFLELYSRPSRTPANSMKAS